MTLQIAPGGKSHCGGKSRIVKKGRDPHARLLAQFSRKLTLMRQALQRLRCALDVRFRTLSVEAGIDTLRVLYLDERVRYQDCAIFIHEVEVSRPVRRHHRLRMEHRLGQEQSKPFTA